VTNLLGQELGPYRVESELGCGGMGQVYSATALQQVHGIDAGTRVAIKVVHPHLLASPGYFKRFLQEAEVGRRVRHPNVVRTFDADAIQIDDHVVHFLVMEYVEGQSLRRFLDDLGTVPEAILREIALQTAAGLTAIHAQKIVHRDIKPENILITDDHEIRIMDLGVAKVLEATLTIAQGNQFAGSMLYGAPEQFGEVPVGPAADLYSLGTTLFELATGENPFRRDSQAAVIEAHLHYSPPALDHRNPEYTRFFSALVGKLVAKVPKERFVSAQALHLALEEGERSAWWLSTEPRLGKAPDSVPRIPVRRETELHARDEQLATLQRAWVDARAGRGAVVFVEGEAGIGKTRLLDAFARSLPGDDMHIVYGSYPPSGGIGGISEAIVGKFGEAGLCASLAPYLTVTPSLVSGFSALVTQSGPPPDGHALSWEGFMAVCVHLMQALAEERPLLWMIDDLHFAPKESRDVALAMARAVAGRKVLLVVTARPGLPEEELAHLGRLENFVRITLQRLGARDVVELLRAAMKSEKLAQKLGGAIAYQSDGVPFFVFEMIRGLEQGQYIEKSADGSYVQTQVISEIEVPSAVKDLIQGRLSDLDREQRAILDVGSVQGLRFDPALVANVLDLKRVQILQDIAQIERQTGLVRGAVGAVEFDQHQIQEVLYGGLLPDLRQEYHTLLAAAFADRLRDEPTEKDCAFLASHLLRGSEPERALPHLLPALNHLAATYRNEALIDMAGRALAFKEQLDAGTRIDILLHMAGCLGLLGRRELEQDALAEAAGVADQTGEPRLQSRARVALAQHLIDTSQMAEAIEVAESILPIANDPESEIGAESALGRAQWSIGQFGRARPHLERRMKIALATGDPAAEASARGDLGNLEKSVGRYAEAHAHFERQLAIALETGDLQSESAASGNLGTACKVVGRFEEARTYLERHRELAREIGDRMGESSAAGNLGLVCKHLGELEEARALFDESLEVSREIGNRLGEARASGHCGLVAKSLGRFEEAQSCFERSRDLSRELGDTHGEVIAIGNLGNVLFDLGRFEEALAHYGEWLATAQELGDRQGEAVALGNLGNALDALGRFEQAYGHFEQSHRIACEIGDREGEGIALADLGALLLRLGARERATEKLERSLAIVREIGARRSEGYVLHGLGAASEQAGDFEEATRRYEAAHRVYSAIHHAVGEVETELALGRLDAESEAGRAYLERSLASARSLELPSVFIPAACLLGAADAVGLLAWHETRMSLVARMESHYVLWRATDDEEHIARAHDLLAELRSGAASEYRDSMIESVPLHRDIEQAWRDAALRSRRGR